MNTNSDSTLAKPAGTSEVALEETQADATPLLVDLGRVSDTQGGVWGPKFDNGAGFVTY